MSNEEQWLLKEKYNGVANEAFLEDCSRLTAGEPLAYLIGHIPFAGTMIYLDSRPLIPRVETEFWVAEAITAIRRMGITYSRVLDLCAGSGCIGIAIAKHVPDSYVDFIEIDTRHHETIHKNIVANSIEENRVKISGGDLFEQAEGPYDFILSNPPYLSANSTEISQSVREFEPELALYGGVAGMEHITRIIQQTPQQLAPLGTLFIEHDPEQTAAVLQCAHECGMSAATHTDQYGVARYTTVRMAQ